jgi:thermostable 8-oxoguanine DNA glycosylase
MTIIPTSITNFNRNTRELQAFWLFCICVAGRNSKQVAIKVNQLTDEIPNNLFPFAWLKMKDIRSVLEKHKMGQYTRISKAIEQSLDLDLRTVDFAELEKIHGVGPKTSRFFLLHSRKNVELAVLDTHILKWLGMQVTDAVVPKVTPQKDYRFWETVFINVAKARFPDMSIADIDLEIWKTGSQKV